MSQNMLFFHWANNTCPMLGAGTCCGCAGSRVGVPAAGEPTLSSQQHAWPLGGWWS